MKKEEFKVIKDYLIKNSSRWEYCPLLYKLKNYEDLLLNIKKNKIEFSTAGKRSNIGIFDGGYFSYFHNNKDGDYVKNLCEKILLEYNLSKNILRNEKSIKKKIIKI